MQPSIPATPSSSDKSDKELLAGDITGLIARAEALGLPFVAIHLTHAADLCVAETSDHPHS